MQLNREADLTTTLFHFDVIIIIIWNSLMDDIGSSPSAKPAIRKRFETHIFVYSGE